MNVVIDLFKKKVLILLSAVNLLFSSPVAGAATLIVPDDFSTISEAIEKADPEDTILLREGNYNDNLVISKSITVKSDRDGNVTFVRALDPSKPVFSLSNTNNVTISGLSITGSGLAGIYMENTTQSVIRDNRIMENGTGLYLYESDHNILMNNAAESNEQSGIYLELSHNNRVENNRADSNKEKGIFLNSSNNNSILDNSASKNAWNGVTLWSSNNNTLQGNRVLRNTYSIVMSNSTENIVADNSTWTNFRIILPIILVYSGVILYWVQRRIFSIIYRRENV